MKKICSKCGETKELELFVKCKKCKDGTTNVCLSCRKENYKEYLIKNSERIKRQKKEWAINNPESIKSAQTKFRQNNPEKCAELQKTWRQNNPEKYKEHKKKYRKKNPEWNKVQKRKNYMKSIENLSDRYLKARLKANGFENEIINTRPELIELEKIIIKTKRLCKTSKNLEMT